MKRLSVLIADDEIPYDDEERDGQTKNLLLKNTPGATEADYVKGRDGMKHACAVLREAAMELTIARTAKEAIKEIGRKHFDVAIIDLGWMGDRNADNKETAGWEILEELRQNEQGCATPVIMYSNRFDSNLTLAQTAAERGTLPLPKTYTPGSHQTLVAAIRFLASPGSSPSEQFFVQALKTWKEREAELTNTSRLCRRLLLWAVVPIIIASVIILLLQKTDAAKFQLIASVVIGALLGFASRQVGLAAQRSEKAMQEVSKHLQRPQQHETPAA